MEQTLEKTCPIIPMAGQVILREPTRREKTPGGIFLPSNAVSQQGCTLGEIVQAPLVLDENWLGRNHVVRGNIAIIPKNFGTTVHLDGVDYILVDVKDVQGVIPAE